MTKINHYARVTDPLAAATNTKIRRVGGVPTRDIIERAERSSRFEIDAPTQLMTFALGPFFRENVPASAPTGANVRSMIPADATTFASTGTGLNTTMFTDGRVVGAYVRSNNNVTAGSLTVGVIIGSDPIVLISDCVLDTTNPVNMFVPLPWESGIPFAAGEGLRAMFSTDAAFAPATLEVIVTLYLGFESS